MPIKLNDQYKNKVVSFNGKAVALGERDDLYILARKAMNGHHFGYLFDDLPSIEEMDKIEKQVAQERSDYLQSVRQARIDARTDRRNLNRGGIQSNPITQNPTTANPPIGKTYEMTGSDFKSKSKE